jgi:hypothetical protein
MAVRQTTARAKKARWTMAIRPVPAGFELLGAGFEPSKKSKRLLPQGLLVSKKTRFARNFNRWICNVKTQPTGRLPARNHGRERAGFRVVSVLALTNEPGIWVSFRPMIPKCPYVRIWSVRFGCGSINGFGRR